MRTWTRFPTVVAVLAVAGILVAGLLTSFHYSEASEARFCSEAAGCGTVNTSEYSTIGPVPVAVVGLLGYVGILAVVAAAARRPALAPWAPPAVFGMALVGVLYSVYLTYLELFVIHAVCPWCVVSAVLISLIFIAAVVEVRRSVRHQT